MVWRRGNILRKQDAVEMQVYACRWLYNQLNRKESHHLCGKIVKNKTLGRGRALLVQKHLRALSESKLTDTWTHAGGSCSPVWWSRPGPAFPHRRSSSGRSRCWGSETPSGQPPAQSGSPGTSASIQPGSGVTGEWPILNHSTSAALCDKAWPILTVLCFGLFSACDNQLPVMHTLVVLVGYA